ncbi:MAG: hypothetical protein KDE50_06795, partial [Caldilineaceae bacterium]|nr:hypothetical protein [Caldilineaceae bacterium]
STISETLDTDLVGGAAVDTTLTETPASTTNSTSASFRFTGNADAVAFECRLDDAAAVPCASPWMLTDLSNGSHTFTVAALNSQGTPDLTPASYSWTVNVTTLATTLTAQPAAETTNRTASFSFSASGASDFACSLDGSSYSACASPQRYEKLGNGHHTFLVRATGGPAARYVWHITNAAPTVAGDQGLMVGENGAVNVTLQGADDEPLRYQIVEPPQHGFLLGLAPALTYVPNTGYAGPDSFIYRAWDGQAYSSSATVHLTVRLAKYAVFAEAGVAFEQNSAVVRGDVGVNTTSSGPFLRNNVEASFSQNAQMQDPNSRVLADSIVVENKALIYNPSYNELTGKGTVNGTRTTPLVLPLRAGSPALPAIAAGTQAVTVNGNQTLAAGSYGALTVGNNATLVLSGGLYQFAGWNVSQGAKIHFAAPSEVRIAGVVAMSQNAFVGPAPGATAVDANQIVLYVAGASSQGGNFPAAVSVAQNAALNAYVVAPNGLITLQQNANATGIFIGKWFLAAQNAKVARPAESAVAGADIENAGPESAEIAPDPAATPPLTVTLAPADITSRL